MTVKEWLRSGRKIMYETRKIRERVETAESMAMSTTVQGNSERVQTSAVNSTECKNIALIDLKAMYNNELTKMYQKQAEMERLISSLEDYKYRETLRQYYIDCKTWQKVADSMHFDVRWVLRLHGQALKQLEPKYKKAIESHY